MYVSLEVGLVFDVAAFDFLRVPVVFRDYDNHLLDLTVNKIFHFLFMGIEIVRLDPAVDQIIPEGSGEDVF